MRTPIEGYQLREQLENRRIACASNLTEWLLSLGCVDAGESRDELDVFGVQNDGCVFG